MPRFFMIWGGSPDATDNEEAMAYSEEEQDHLEGEGDDVVDTDADALEDDVEADATGSGIGASHGESAKADDEAAERKGVATKINNAGIMHGIDEYDGVDNEVEAIPKESDVASAKAKASAATKSTAAENKGDDTEKKDAPNVTDEPPAEKTDDTEPHEKNPPKTTEGAHSIKAGAKSNILSSIAKIMDANDNTLRQNQSQDPSVIYESIGDDLVIPVGTPSAAAARAATPPLSASGSNQVDNAGGTGVEQYDDSFPKAKDFLADLISVHEEEETCAILPEQAAEIVCGFDEDDDGNNDTRTVVTMRTTATGVTTASRRIHSSLREETLQHHVSHEHQSLFDILDRNFADLGDCRADGSGNGRDIGYEEVKLCFVAFVVVFGVPQPAVVEADACLSREEEHTDDEAEDEMHEIKGQAKQPSSSDEVKKVPRPNVPLSVAFALWKQVLRLPQYGNGNAASATMLSYIRSTLVLLGLLELSSIENEDSPVPTSAAGRSRYQLKSSAIECLRVHHDINQQYGEYLAWGDHDSSFRSKIEQHQRQWNDAVMDESLQIGSNDFTIRMLPLNTMRAHHMQDTFDLLKDKSFVRRRVRLLGSSDAAAAHIRDVDELLRIIDRRVKANDATLEAVDEQDGVLNAYEQMKKYCLYLTNELMKHNISEDENNPEGVTVTGLAKAALSKISNVGNALHLLGSSLGGYGFFDQEMEYYKEALRLKELCAKGKVEQSVAVSDTLHCMGFSLDNAGKSEEALEFYDRALDIRLDYLGEDDLRVAETLHNKGALLCEADRSEEAMECLEEALRIRELHYGEEHESCADTMQWMGNLLRKHGDPSDALDYFKFSLRIKQTRLGADHIDVANTLFNTAVLLDDVEKYELSLIAYKEACRIRKLVLGDLSPDVADNLFCLGNVATAMEKHEEALGYFNESIKIREALIKEDDIYSVNLDDSLLFISNPNAMNPGLLVQYERLSQCLEEVLPLTKLLEGTNHESVCKLLKRMGDVYKKLRDWDNAIGSIQGALRVKRADEASTDDDLEVAELLQRKGEAHLYKAEFSRAKSTFDAALRVRENLLGRESVEFASSLYCLGAAYHNLKDYARSKLLFQECIRIQTKHLGKEDLHIAQSMCWLGRNHQELNEPSKALEKYLSALKLCKKNKDMVDYRIVVMLLHAIGLIYEDDTINLLDMALKCYIEEIHLIETKLDAEDIEVTKVLVLAHLKAGLLYQKQEDVGDSIEHLTLGLDLTKQWEDDSQDSTMAMITDTLGVLYVSRGDYETAKKFFSDSYSIYEKTLGRDHITTADCAFKLADCLEHVGSNLALDFYAESLRVQRLNITDDDDERVGSILFSIGRIHFSKEKYIDAANSFDEALNVRRRLLGDCATVAVTYHELANSYVQMKQYEKGLIFYKECVRITKKHGEKNDLYSVALDMASCCETMENYQLAIECYNDCLEATEELSDDHNIAFVLQRMGEIHLTKLHNYPDATKLFLDALELLRTDKCMSDEDQCSVLCLIFQVGQAYALAKDYENALDFYEEHIKLVESREPVDDELVANSLLEMGMILAIMGDEPDYELAAEKLSECLDIRRKILGPDNEQVADVLHKLAGIYEKSEQYTQAVDCLSEALRTFKMKQMFSETSATYHTLAKLKAAAAEKSGADSDRKAAIECYEAAISTRRRDPALDDLELASMLYEYATLLCLDNSYDTAMPLLEEALRIQKSKKGLKDERVANILLRTAECHVHGNKYDASLVCLEQALFIQSSLESCDIDAVLLNHLLGITYLERENYPKAISTSLKALKLMKVEASKDSLECADVFANLGKAYGKLHEYDKAIESLVEALRIQKVELGNDSLEYAESVLHLAEIHVATKKHVQALNCLNESIRVFEACPDEENALIDALETAGDCQFILKDYHAAESTFHKCINLIESQDVDTNNERLASLLHRLGKTSACSNDHENAFTSYREAIKLYTKALGSDNLQVANVLFDVGLLTLDDDENEKAAQCFTEVMRIYTHNGEESNTKVADALVQMGTIYANKHEDHEATEAVNKAVVLYHQALESDAVEIGKALLLRGRLNDHAGDHHESMSNFMEALRIFQASLDENDMNVSLALSNIGVAHSRIKEYPEAIEKCKEALRIRKMHTDNDRDVADSLFNIGNLYDEWGKYEEAVPYLEGSLKLYRSLFGHEDISIANCQNKLGAMYWKLSDVERAIDSFTDALYVCEEADGEDEHEDLLTKIYKGLGDCYFHAGDLDLALESFISCVKMQKVVFGGDCIEMAATCDCIGLVYEKKNKHEEAIQFYNKALVLYEQYLGKASSECLAIHLKISNALLSKSKYEDAIHNLRECAQLYTREGKGKSEDAAMIYHQLGTAQGKISNYEDAIGSFNKALNIRTKISGKVNIKVVETMMDIGSAFQETSEPDEALAMFDEVISILHQLPESDQFKIPDIYTTMADILKDQGKYETSLNTLKRALKMYSKQYESDSMQVAKTLIRLGQVYNDLDNLEKATGCYSEGIRIFRSKTLERSVDDNIFMSQAMSQLGKVYARKKMHGKAIELCTESLKIQKKYSSEETIGSVAQSCLVIADILSEWGKADQALQFFEEALRIYLEYVGAESTEVATCYHGIGLAQKRMGDHKNALTSFGKSLRIHRVEEGDKSLPVADDLFQIGQIYDSFVDKSKAYQCFQECLKIRQANLSDDDLDLLATRRYVDTLRRKLQQ